MTVNKNKMHCSVSVFLFVFICELLALHAEPDSFFVQDVNDAGVNSFLRGLIENYRQVMRTGLPNKDIPVMDPLFINRTLRVEMSDKQANMEVNLTDVETRGLSDFVVERLNANLNQSTIYIEARFPELASNGSYTMEGRIIEIVPIRGNGTFWAASKDVKLRATARVHIERESSVKKNSYLQINEDLDVNIDYDKMQMDLEGIEGSSGWTAVVKKILNVTSKDFIKRFVPSMKEDLNKAVVEGLNKGLKKIPFYFWSSGEEYVDEVLEEISQMIRKSDNPLPLPDFHGNFSKEILFTTVTGSAKLRKRTVRGVENIKRVGVPVPSTNKTHMIINGELAIENIQFLYGGHMRFMTIVESVFCKVFIPEVKFSFQVIHSNERETKPKLQDMRIIGQPKVSIEISDLGHLEWMTTWLNAGFTEHVDKILRKTIPAQLADYFQRTFSN